MCHSGVGLTPTVDGTLHHFSAGGLYNGLVLLIDDETRSYWDHISGECVHGPSKGKVLDDWTITLTNVTAALKKDLNLTISLSSPPLFARLFSWIHRNGLRSKGVLPPGFRGTMAQSDDRLPDMTHGIGIVVDKEARFYPMAKIGSGLTDNWGNKTLRIAIGEEDSVPYAEWQDGGRPFQLFARWYGFAYTYPHCDIVPTPVAVS